MAVEQRSFGSAVDAHRIREPLFTTVKRGYEPKEVLEYLSGVASEVEALQSRIRELESDRAEAHGSAGPGQVVADDPYERLSAHVADVMRAFDQNVDRVQEEKRAEAERILAEARTEADRIRSDAQGQAEEARAFAERAAQDAEKKAMGALSGLASRRQALLEDLRTIHDHILGANMQLEAVIEEAPPEDHVVVADANDGEPANASA
jgi:cell division septum initiation protein DivIVA